MRVLLLRPPRYIWPFNSERSAFWQPLGLLSLAAAVRRALPLVEIEVWDAPAQHWGWRTLERKLAARRIDVLGIGEETVSAHEALRAARLVRALHPECIIVAGGTYFSNAIASALDSGVVDVVVRGEGEQSLVELLGHIHDRGSWHGMAGLAFAEGDRHVITPARKLIDDLDTLPWPAYDLVDMDRYGRGSRNHPALVSLEHSRGCIDACGFCVLWSHMGEHKDGNGEVRPRFRTKSAARSFDEVIWLYQRFGRRTFAWVDPTFNASPAWSDAWAERMLSSDLVSRRRQPRTLHTAWVRADCILRDEQLGILPKLVKAGLRQVVIGLERDDPAGLAVLNKHRNDPELCRQAMAILREKYPEVYTIGSIIFGLPSDTEADLRRIVDWYHATSTDFCFLIPLTPCPGTPLAQQLEVGGYVTDTDLRHHNFHSPVCRTDTLDLRALENAYWRATLGFQPRRVLGLARRLLLEPESRKRRVNSALYLHAIHVALKSLVNTTLRSCAQPPVLYSRKPPWYDS